ncbi:VWA domain-containing protein [Streptomyces sp. NPDC002490]|uniref:VWA domain-containing protein n=1 Tax=Streptomyces sp. NPDC002490 TaxID=3154416 RepID=UPI00332C43E2
MPVDPGAPPATERPSVRLAVDQWKYLSATEPHPRMHVILSVQVTGTGGDRRTPLLAQVLVVDCSGSMSQEKMHAAQRATAAAIRKLPDGAPFAVVRGDGDATVVYPDTGGTARADDRSRRAAERAVRRLVAGGTTCIGAWLDLSRRLLAEQDAPIGHVLLLTDGKNQDGDRMPLAEVLEGCAGRFVCDAWGIGDGWDGRELLRITSRLHGSASAVREEASLPAAYEELMDRLLAKTVPRLDVLVTPMTGTVVRYLKQVHPTEAWLHPEGGSHRFVTRAWGDETRRYQLCLDVDPAGRPRREDLQLAVVALDAPGVTGLLLPQPQPCEVHWTEDASLSAHTDAHVAHFEQHQQLGEAVAAATDAHRRGQPDRAAEHLGRAVQIAEAMGARTLLRRLSELVDPGAPAGPVRLRPGVTTADFEHLITASSRSTFGPPSAGATAVPQLTTAARTTCVDCARPAPATARFCPSCGHRFPEQRP